MRLPAIRHSAVLLTAALALLCEPLIPVGEAAAAGAAAAGNAARAAKAGGNPHASPADVAAGAKIFRSSCGACHGRSGTGGRGPDLTRGRFRHAETDQDLFDLIFKGIPRVGMPGLEYGRSEIAIWQVVAFVQSLSKGRAGEKIPGDPAVGERLFRSEADCATCHRVNGEGGRRGPDLSDVGWLRSPEHLRTSLLKPNDHVEPRWWSARLNLAGGDVVEGIRMDEDSFSVRLLDAEEHLRTFRKGEVKSYERIETSTMPSYEGALDARQLDDLVAYLYSLRQTGR